MIVRTFNGHKQVETSSVKGGLDAKRFNLCLPAQSISIYTVNSYIG